MMEATLWCPSIFEKVKAPVSTAKHILIAAIACAILAATADRAGAISFTNLNNPLGVKGSAPYGISGDTIVGTYSDRKRPARFHSRQLRLHDSG